MFREKMGHVTEWMQRAQLPRHVKEKIRCYYSEVSRLLAVEAKAQTPTPPLPPLCLSLCWL